MTRVLLEDDLTPLLACGTGLVIMEGLYFKLTTRGYVRTQPQVVNLG